MRVSKSANTRGTGDVAGKDCPYSGMARLASQKYELCLHGNKPIDKSGRTGPAGLEPALQPAAADAEGKRDRVCGSCRSSL
jgi:hypothetical protein